MKKAYVFLAFLIVFVFSGCADNTFNSGIQISNNGNVQVNLSEVEKGITVGASQVTNAVIRLTSPTGDVQTVTWTPGSPNVYYFHADTTGTYNFGLTQTDTSNRTYSTNVNYSFTAGFNYYISVNLGGFVTVDVSTNGSGSSATSISASYSSVYSSASSRSSSSLSSVISSSSSRSSSSLSSAVSSSSMSSAVVSSAGSASAISGIQVTDITSYTAIIRWNTAVPADSQVLYGLDDWLPFATTVDPTLVTNHAVMLVNLIPWGHYYFKTRSVDASANVYQSDLLSFDTPIDMTPPVISGVRTSNVTANSVIILWNTDEPGDNQADCWYYEGSSKITLSRYTSDKVWSHSITVTGLPSSKLIYFNVTSVNGAGMGSTSGNYTFTTL